jgi:hypothetical protein
MALTNQKHWRLVRQTPLLLLQSLLIASNNSHNISLSSHYCSPPIQINVLNFHDTGFSESKPLSQLQNCQSSSYAQTPLFLRRSYAPYFNRIIKHEYPSWESSNSKISSASNTIKFAHLAQCTGSGGKMTLSTEWCMRICNSYQPHYDPGVDSPSNRNENQGHLQGRG